MVIGTLLALRAGLAARAGEERTSGAGAKVDPGARPSIPRSFWDGPPQQALGAPFPDWFAAAPGGADEDASPAASPDVGEAELQAGNWGAVRSLLRVLEGGAASKVDGGGGEGGSRCFDGMVMAAPSHRPARALPGSSPSYLMQ